MPPSTAQPTPLTRLAASDARNATTAAISSACPSRPCGETPSAARRAASASSNPEVTSASIGVSIMPGEHRVDADAGGRDLDAAERVRPSTACLAAL